MTVFKLKTIHKIPLASILLVLIIIFTRVVAINNLPVVPFLRISLGPSLIVFSSLLLGPIYGAFIGGLSDILGIVMFPNAYSINPLFTLVYFLFGLTPPLLYWLVKKIKKEITLFIINCIVLFSIALFVTLFVFLNPEFTLYGVKYLLPFWSKILISTLSFITSISLVIAIYFINRYYHRKNDSYQLDINKFAFIAIVNNLVWMLGLNSLIKTFFFDINFFIIFFTQALMFIFDILISTFLIPYLFLLVHHIYRKYLNQ